MVGQAFAFDGANGLTVPWRPGYDLSGAGFTAEFWVKADVAQQPGELAYELLNRSAFGGAEPSGWTFGVSASGGWVAFDCGDGSGFSGVVGVSSGDSIVDGQWHHVAGVWDGSYIYLYVDANLQGSTPLTPPAGAPEPLRIGYYLNGDPSLFFSGEIDEIAIFNRALSPVEIGATYAAGSNGMCKALQILVEPQGALAVVGVSNAPMSVVASGMGTLSYQWQNDATNLPGQTTSALLLPNPQPDDAGHYTVTVTDATGAAVTSAVAVLEVRPICALISAGPVSGELTTNCSPYVVTGGVWVSNTLTIDAGVVMRFQPGTVLTIQPGASLNVIGTEDLPVLFTADQTPPAPGYWTGIQIQGSLGEDAFANMSYATIEYATDGIFGSGFNQAWSRMSPTNITVRYCSRDGIHVEASGSDVWSLDFGLVVINLFGCSIQSNGGNGVYLSAMSPWAGGEVDGSIENCIIADNSAAGIVALGSGVINCAIQNCVVYGNGGDGLVNNTLSYFWGAVRNNIIALNAAGMDNLGGEDISSQLLFNDVWNNSTNWVGLPSGFDPGTNGNISVDPLFANPTAFDFHLRSQAGRYVPATGLWVRDSVTSPCIDAGDPSSSFINEPEPNGGRINMGAYGNTPFASKSLPRLTGSMDISTGNFVLSWGCAPSNTYQVLYSSSPAGPWLGDLPNSQLTSAPDQTVLAYTNMNSGGQTARFYRLVWFP
jgi:hypothetical protein